MYYVVDMWLLAAFEGGLQALQEAEDKLHTAGWRLQRQ